MRGVKGVKLASILLILAFAAAFVAWYVTVTTERERYLTRRNFRLLATIATQLDSSIGTQERTFQTLLSAVPVSGSDWFEDSRDHVPSLQALDRNRLPERFPDVGTTTTSTFTGTTRVAIEGRDVWLRLSIDREARGPGTATPDSRLAYLHLADLVAPMFEPKLRDGAFDTLVLASTDGQVLHAEGARSGELARARLDALAAPRRLFQSSGEAGTAARPAGFLSVARTNGTVDVLVSGSEYKLFTQPCCSATWIETAGSPGLVLVGLIEAPAFAAKARQIPTTIVFLFSASILLAVAGWPFLRLRLLGERQRIRRLEVVQVIASGLLCIALLTVCCLDWYAYWHLNTVRDGQLKKLAQTMTNHVAAELTDARGQLQALTPAALNCAAARDKTVQAAARHPLVQRDVFTPNASRAVALCGQTRDADAWPAKSDESAMAKQPYPGFKTMALIDKAGKQSVKWASRKWQPGPIDVAGRAYFKDAKDGRLWHLDDASSPKAATGYTLESIWSWTTAEPEAVIAIPTSDEGYPVAALTIPMTSLIEPVVPDGFEFAVIAEDGAVLFHSDPQRNTHENLFEETDQNRRLRAAVTAHIAEHVDLRYAGRSYRSYVQRLGAGTPWAVVILSNNEPIWALHTEWLVLSLAALLAFLLFLAAVFALCFFTGRAEWLWADSRQLRRYHALSVMTLALLGLSLVVLGVAGNRTVVTVSVMVPLASWAISYLVVRRARGPMPRLDAHPEWGSLAVLLFLLTGIVPAAGILTSVYRLDVRADVKHAQLQFARQFAGHEQRREEMLGDYVGARSWPSKAFEARYDLYHRPLSPAERNAPGGPFTPGDLLSARLETVPDPLSPEWRPPDSAPDAVDEIAETIAEEYLPYYSERAVQIRELLLHQRADDDAWWWRNGDLYFTRPRGQQGIIVAAPVPQLASGLAGPSFPVPGLLLVLAALGLTALTWAVVRFIEVHVCLRGVDEPLWSKVRGTGSSGQNLFVICDADERARLAEDCFEVRFEGEGWLTDDALTAKLIERDHTAPGSPVLVADFDAHLDNPLLARRKLAWIEQLADDDTLTVIVLSSDRPSRIDQSLRAQPRAGAASAQLLERWRAVLASFIVIDWRTHPDSRRLTGAPWWRRVLRDPLPLTVDGVRDLIDLRNDHGAIGALDAEARADAFVRAVCASIESRLPVRGDAAAPPPAPAAIDVPAPAAVTAVGTAPRHSTTVRLSPEQVLDEVADRADAWYRRIWRSCTPDEQLVLAEIASEGFVNYKSRRTVRRLLGRQLIAKDPSFRLMNETFRRFVLSSACQADIRVIEGASEPSLWDRWRVPFFSGVIGLSLFFLVTQRELFNATIATLSTLTAALPVLARVIAIVVGKRVELEPKA